MVAFSIWFNIYCAINKLWGDIVSFWSSRDRLIVGAQEQTNVGHKPGLQKSSVIKPGDMGIPRNSLRADCA